jgi:hypothetical protein
MAFSFLTISTFNEDSDYFMTTLCHGLDLCKDANSFRNHCFEATNTNVSTVKKEKKKAKNKRVLV